MANDESHAQAIRDVTKLEAENRDLRQWLCDVLKALGNGSGASPECSMQFLSFIPEEVRLTVAGLRSSLVQGTEATAGGGATHGVAPSETVPIEEYRRVVARCIQLGEKIAAGVKGLDQPEQEKRDA